MRRILLEIYGRVFLILKALSHNPQDGAELSSFFYDSMMEGRWKTKDVPLPDPLINLLANAVLLSLFALYGLIDFLSRATKWKKKNPF